jgi:hypothetical protein
MRTYARYDRQAQRPRSAYAQKSRWQGSVTHGGGSVTKGGGGGSVTQGGGLAEEGGLIREEYKKQKDANEEVNEAYSLGIRVYSSAYV